MRRDNYAIQAAQAKKLFLSYDQQMLIKKCQLTYDAQYLYTEFLNQPYRIHRQTGDMERMEQGEWLDGNSFHEVMTILDWLCDGKEDRHHSGRWVNMVDLGRAFHTQLQEDVDAPYGRLFDANRTAFANACKSLGGKPADSADISYELRLIDDLAVLIQLWHGDEEFPPRLRCLWDENTTQYIRYETIWYARAYMLDRIATHMKSR